MRIVDIPLKDLEPPRTEAAVRDLGALELAKQLDRPRADVLADANALAKAGNMAGCNQLLEVVWLIERDEKRKTVPVERGDVR